MLFNVIVFLLIIMVTLYLATQGMLSSLLALATSIFSSILAMGLMEPLHGIIAGWRLDYARGVTFLALFLVIFTITRFAADYAVPKNIKLSLWVNRAAGGFIGFFTGLVVVGTLVIGLEMLPLPRVMLGYDRFPETPNGIAGQAPGQPAHMTNVWFSPDRFVLALWKGASGRSLGGARRWSAVHPDLSVESYGYRSNVYVASGRSIAPDLFSVSSAWSVPASDARAFQPAQALGIPDEPGKRIVMIRTEVQKGDAAKSSADNGGADTYFRISASQIRLVTNQMHQYYPIGYLEQGDHFVALPLDSGHIVEDYVKGKVVEDWVFSIAEDEDPALVEMKQFGRKEFAKGAIGAEVAAPLAASNYPQHAYLKDLASLSVNIDLRGRKLITAHVYLLKPNIEVRDIKSEVINAYDKSGTILGDIDNNSGGWSKERKPGVPDANAFSLARNLGPQITNAVDEKSPEGWVLLFPLLLAGQAQPNGEDNLAAYPHYFDDTLVPLWKNARDGSEIIDSAVTTDAPTMELKRVIAGNHTIVITLLTDRGFFVWYNDHNFDPSENMKFNAAVDGQGENAPGWKIDLDQK